MRHDLLRKLPQIEKALQWATVQPLIETFSRTEVTQALREVLLGLRSAIVGDSPCETPPEAALEPVAIADCVARALARRRLSSYRKVINGTGIILHTGLGRAVLPREALDEMRANLAGYSVVEVDAESGERNQREDPLQPLLRELTGAEAATVVNNNAGATLLILAAMARDRDVIISRGQLVEIGGSFRIPDILEESGARLVEVGATNRTYLSDYRAALTPETGMLLKVHTSNYEIQGFAHHTPLEELVALGREHGIPVVSDLGSGCFLDLSPYGFRREPLVSESVGAGADLVCFSGDKLLGGPQAGVIVGTEKAVARVRRHPLFRALRVDKTTLTLLEATLRLYRTPEKVLRHVWPLRLLSATGDDVRRRAEAFRESLDTPHASRLTIEVVETTSQMGSGSLPAQAIPSWALALRHATRSAPDLAQALRSASPPVFTRTRDDRVLIDVRTLLEDDEADLRRILIEQAGRA